MKAMDIATYILCFFVGIAISDIYYTSQINELKYKHSEAINKAAEDIRSQELLHRSKESELLNTMAQEKDQYEKDIISINNDYNDRLLKSEERADRYKHQAESGSECSSLAKHTTKLDRSLEEGIRLVNQLVKSSRHQQQLLVTCTNLIKNDRELLK